MHDYYCNNCDNIIGKCYYNKFYDIITFCDRTKSKNINSIYFLNCKYCNKFIGLLCGNVCCKCFGKNLIFGENNLFNWFQKYKKTREKYSTFNYFCKICNEKIFRLQYWFFGELTFINKNV